MGCSLWINYKLFNKKPIGVTGNDFQESYKTHGPLTAYKGWATNGGMAYNYSILTKATSVCDLHSGKEKLSEHEEG